MFVNQVLFRYENVASEGFLTFWNAGMLFVTFQSENSQISRETIKFWAAKATKIIKISDLIENADVIKIFF